MNSQKSMHAVAGLVGLAVNLLASTAWSAPIVTTFASGASVGATSPDSVTVGGGSVWVEYSNGASGDGTDNTSSTIVRYGMNGAVQQTFSLSGNVDGLKYNPTTNQVFATHNQDGNSSLSIINAANNTVGPAIPYAVPSSTTRGFDDYAFPGGINYATHTNPSATSNDILDTIGVTTNPLTVTPVLTTAASATNIKTGAVTTLGSVDTDSLKALSGNRLLITDAANGRVIFVNNPGSGQAVSFLQLTDPTGVNLPSIDDVNYVTSPTGTILLADPANNRIVSIYDTSFSTNNLYVSPDTSTYFGIADANGVVAPYITGVGSPHDWHFCGQRRLGQQRGA